MTSIAARVAAGAGLYTSTVFALGAVLGTVRTLLLEPRLGSLASTLLELPIMLLASWLLCRWTLRRVPLPPRAGPRIALGVAALALLLLAEYTLWTSLGGAGLAAFVRTYDAPAAQLGLAAQCAFAAFPWWQGRRQPG